LVLFSVGRKFCHVRLGFGRLFFPAATHAYVIRQVPVIQEGWICHLKFIMINVNQDICFGSRSHPSAKFSFKLNKRVINASFNVWLRIGSHSLDGLPDGMRTDKDQPPSHWMAIDRVDTESVLMRTDQTRELGVHREPKKKTWIQIYMYVVM
jgi:hypothetical protein